MEDVLYQYALPYDPRRPLICFDERPCFLIGDVGSILPMSPGKAKRYHYEYEKNGSCCVFLAFEPQTGRRYVAAGQAHLASERVFRYSEGITVPSEAPCIERRTPHGYACALIVS
jgi:hypothetical protein